MTHRKEKMQSIRPDPKMTQITKLVEKHIRIDIINIPHMLKKVKESMSMMRREKIQIKIGR